MSITSTKICKYVLIDHIMFAFSNREELVEHIVKTLIDHNMFWKGPTDTRRFYDRHFNLVVLNDNDEDFQIIYQEAANTAKSKLIKSIEEEKANKEHKRIEREKRMLHKLKEKYEKLESM